MYNNKKLFVHAAWIINSVVEYERENMHSIRVQYVHFFSVRKPFVFAAIRLCVRISSLDVQLHYLWKYQRFDATQCLIDFELVVSLNAGLVFLYGDYHINGVFLIFL